MYLYFLSTCFRTRRQNANLCRTSTSGSKLKTNEVSSQNLEPSVVLAGNVSVNKSCSCRLQMLRDAHPLLPHRTKSPSPPPGVMQEPSGGVPSVFFHGPRHTQNKRSFESECSFPNAASLHCNIKTAVAPSHGE